MIPREHAKPEDVEKEIGKILTEAFGPMVFDTVIKAIMKHVEDYAMQQHSKGFEEGSLGDDL